MTEAYPLWRARIVDAAEKFSRSSTPLLKGPAFDLLGVPPVRVTKRLDAATGEQAVALSRRAAAKK